MNDTMNTTSDQSEIEIPARRPSPFETYGVLGVILAQASQVTGWDDHTLSMAIINWNGDISVSLTGQSQGEELATRLDLVETDRSASPSAALYPGDDTNRIKHTADWDGTYAGHHVQLRTYWHTSLGDLDLAEGEELA